MNSAGGAYVVPRWQSHSRMRYLIHVDQDLVPVRSRLARSRADPSRLGIYAIGTPEDLGSPVGVAPDYDPYLGLWPENLTPLYVGISESRRSGVRGRLSSHWRRTGNKGIAEFRDRGLR